jgi:DNA-binding transcriptional ArsR family regulator
MDNKIEKQIEALGGNESEAFAALGDWTRLLLVARLATAVQQGEQCSIEQLSGYVRQQGVRLSRQAVTKHLRTLERGRLVRGARHGRERLYELDPVGIGSMQAYLEMVSAHWEQALGRLKDFVESSE